MRGTKVTIYLKTSNGVVEVFTKCHELTPELIAAEYRVQDMDIKCWHSTSTRKGNFAFVMATDSAIRIVEEELL
tara:strand:+ start:3937 stop:4158 length:222 start_codon:yes stop_codon:yes gene_type:complete